jgi:2-amino-4-ketopentanoate thiolase alpha subunit
MAKRGDWVQIYRRVLPAGNRAPQVPEDTQAVALEMWVKGFLDQETGEVGQEGTIVTVTGRLVTGAISKVLPAYSHNFGEPQPELLKIGPELREFLGGGEGDE